MTTHNAESPRLSQAAADAQALALKARGIDYSRPWPRSPYEVDLPKLQAAFGGPAMTHAGAPFHTQMRIGDDVASVPNVTRHDAVHADLINVLPYDNAAGQTQQVAGDPVLGVPCELLAHAAVGDVFWGVSHTNFQHREQDSDLESIKQQMTHVRIYAVVEQGVAVMDFPRSYAFSTRTTEPGKGELNGLINPPAYPSTLYRLVFPDHIGAGAQRAYLDNIRTWALLVNKLARFPAADYNGNDPLGTHDLDQVKAFGHQVLTALDKDASGQPSHAATRALAWLQQAANQLYCTEGAAHLAINLGLNMPLNEATLGPLHWATFLRLLQAGEQRFWSQEYPDAYPVGRGHVGGPPTAQQSPHSLYTRQMAIGEAPVWLQPIEQLAFRPWTAVDMIENVVHRLVPPEQRAAGVPDTRDELVAMQQANQFLSMCRAMEPITRLLKPNELAALQTLWGRIDAMLENPRADRVLGDALTPLFEGIRWALQKDQDQANVLFVPPNRLANPDPGDFIRFEEVGQWVHKDFVRVRP